MSNSQHPTTARNAVHVVHCIDTEGPLHESLEATFERLRVIFQLNLSPSRELLRKLQSGAVDLGGKEAAVQKVLDPRLLSYNDTWDKVDEMLGEAMSKPFRQRMVDSAGNGWVYNWFCVDHVDYEENPRRRDIGYHHVFDHYRGAARDMASHQDGIHFHFHPHNFRREAHRCAAHWWASSSCLWQILSRRIIDRHWFPTAHRPGFHVIRPESHWFLEQYIPFDFSNQSVALNESDQAQFGLTGGRFGDWRRAPCSWVPYHPSADDYQIPGNSRRWIARCLNVGTRYRLITEAEVRRAFVEAQAGHPVILAFTDHDYRDIRPNVEEVRGLLRRVKVDFPNVPFEFSEAVRAMRQALRLPAQPACDLELEMQQVDARTHVLRIHTRTPTFGPQPWLALRTVNGTYHHDNLDIEEPFRRWQYVFDEETLPLETVSHIGVAANNAYGTGTVSVWDVQQSSFTRTVLNPADFSIDNADTSPAAIGAA